MAKKLTEEMVVARSKISDLSKIKRFNCWGSELVEVSVLRKMPSVEVLSLSINNINSLVDFQFCKRLEELYIRQNDIRDINEVCYLRNLPNLKNLWLGENPLAFVEGYRLAVLKALPQLQKLDNIQVTPEELKEAQRKGRNLVHPEDEEQESEEERTQTGTNFKYHEYPEYGSQTTPSNQETDYGNEESEDPRDEVSEESKEYSPPRQQSPPQRLEQRSSYSPPSQTYERGRSNSYERESPKHGQYEIKSQQFGDQYEENNHHCDNNIREIKIVSSQSANCIKEYINADRYVQPYRQSDPGDGSAHGFDRRERFSCSAAHNRPIFPRRPVTRNSNILSAVLRLLKELDYPSLEVVEMEVRSRMDELDE